MNKNKINSKIIIIIIIILVVIISLIIPIVIYREKILNLFKKKKLTETNLLKVKSEVSNEVEQNKKKDCKCNGKTPSSGDFGKYCKQWDSDGTWCYVDKGVCSDQKVSKKNKNVYWSNLACKNYTPSKSDTSAQPKTSTQPKTFYSIGDTRTKPNISPIEIWKKQTFPNKPKNDVCKPDNNGLICKRYYYDPRGKKYLRGYYDINTRIELNRWEYPFYSNDPVYRTVSTDLFYEADGNPQPPLLINEYGINDNYKDDENVKTCEECVKEESKFVYYNKNGTLPKPFEKPPDMTSYKTLGKYLCNSSYIDDFRFPCNNCSINQCHDICVSNLNSQAKLPSKGKYDRPKRDPNFTNEVIPGALGSKGYNTFYAFSLRKKNSDEMNCKCIYGDPIYNEPNCQYKYNKENEGGDWYTYELGTPYTRKLNTNAIGGNYLTNKYLTDFWVPHKSDYITIRKTE